MKPEEDCTPDAPRQEAPRDESAPTTDCDFTAERIVPFIDSELDAEEERAVREHITTCCSCRELFESHASLLLHLDARLAWERKTRSPLADLTFRVRARIRDHRWRQVRRASAAAAILIVAVLFWSLRPGGAPAPDELAASPGGSPSETPVVVDDGGERSTAEPLDAEVEEIIAELDVLVAFEEEGVDLTPELVQVLLDDEFDAGNGDSEAGDVYGIFDYLLEEELTAHRGADL